MEGKGRGKNTTYTIEWRMLLANLIMVCQTHPTTCRMTPTAVPVAKLKIATCPGPLSVIACQNLCYWPGDLAVMQSDQTYRDISVVGSSFPPDQCSDAKLPTTPC